MAFKQPQYKCLLWHPSQQMQLAGSAGCHNLKQWNSILFPFMWIYLADSVPV